MTVKIHAYRRWSKVSSGVRGARRDCEEPRSTKKTFCLPQTSTSCGHHTNLSDQVSHDVEATRTRCTAVREALASSMHAGGATGANTKVANWMDPIETTRTRCVAVHGPRFRFHLPAVAIIVCISRASVRSTRPKLDVRKDRLREQAKKMLWQ
jgi:hypothetical protein